MRSGLLAAALLAPGGALAAPPEPPDFPSPRWVSFAPPDLMLREMEIRQACAQEPPQRREACALERIKSLDYLFEVREGPSEDSRLAGTLSLKPGRSPAMTFRAAGTRRDLPFPLDVEDPDWAYGAFYHTALSRRGPWVKLPRRPFPSPVWVDFRKAFGRMPVLRELADMGVMLLRTPEFEGALVPLVVTRGVLEARVETPGDMDCEARYDEARKDKMARRAKRLRLPLSQVSDGDGHWRLLPKYTRGC